MDLREIIIDAITTHPNHRKVVKRAMNIRLFYLLELNGMAEKMIEILETHSQHYYVLVYGIFATAMSSDSIIAEPHLLDRLRKVFRDALITFPTSKMSKTVICAPRLILKGNSN